jgi:hypothetical protein
VRDRNGCTASVARLRSGEDHVVRLVEFLPGTRAADQPFSDRERLSAATKLAQLDLVLARFAAPVPKVDILWNIAEADRVLPLMPSVDDDGDRILVDRALDRWQAVASRLGGLRSQVIHNDLNRHNMLTAQDGEVVGIIDFGDALEAPLICDLATAISYQLAGDVGDLDRISDMAAALLVEQRRFGPRDVVLGQVADLVEEDRACVIVEVLRRQPLRSRRETVEDVGEERSLGARDAESDRAFRRRHASLARRIPENCHCAFGGKKLR